VEASVITERGCDAAVMVIEEQAYAILREPLGVAFNGSERLRLSNASGSVELARERPTEL
jgi:hypothetical protein